MSNDFERVTAAKTLDIQEFIQPSATTKEIENYLKASHGLEYGPSKVRYLFDPQFFRSNAIDFPKLVQNLSQKYELDFQVPEMVRIAAIHAAIQQRQDPTAPSENERLKDALDSPAGLLFLDGLLKYQDKDDDIERIIRIVNVHSQNLSVTVDGTTREAEFVAEKIACDLLESQHMKPQKDSFFDYVAGKQYTSMTTQRLGIDIDSLFSPEFRQFLMDDIQEDVGWHSAVLSSAPNQKRKEDFLVRCAFHRLEFTMSVFDKESGDQDASEYAIFIADKRWMGSDYVTISSRLNTDDHLFLVRSLIRRLSRK